MRKIISVFIAAVALFAQAQQQTTIQSGQSVQQTSPTTVPRSFNSGNNPPGRAFNQTNFPSGRPFRTFTNQNQFGMTDTNAEFTTNQISQTNQPFQNTTSTNTFGTNGMNSASSQTFNASITNTLSTMSPAQANNVIQVQAGLNALQQIAVNIGGVQNVQQIIQQNPQVQMQLQKIEAQIGALGQGTVKPSSDIVARLSEDLLRASARAQLTPSQQLVIAIVINQACNSGTMTADQIESAANTALANLEGAGVPRAVSHPVGCDLHSIAFELQPNLGM
jgi:hypothetical protein